MNRLRQARWWPAIFAAAQLAVFPLLAGNPTNGPASIKFSRRNDERRAAGAFAG